MFLFLMLFVSSLEFMRAVGTSYEPADGSERAVSEFITEKTACGGADGCGAPFFGAGFGAAARAGGVSATAAGAVGVPVAGTRAIAAGGGVGALGGGGTVVRGLGELQVGLGGVVGFAGGTVVGCEGVGGWVWGLGRVGGGVVGGRGVVGWAVGVAHVCGCCLSLLLFSEGGGYSGGNFL